MRSFLLSRWRVFNFLNFLKTRPSMTTGTLREVWTSHSTLKIRKMSENRLKYFKLTFYIVKEPRYLQIFLNTGKTKEWKSIKLGKGLLIDIICTLRTINLWFHPKAVDRRCSIKNVFLKFANSQEKKYARVSLIKWQVWSYFCFVRLTID